MSTPEPNHNEISMNDRTIDAINAALLQHFTGVEPELAPSGKWRWTFPSENKAEPDQVFEDAPPRWCPDDPNRLFFILDAIAARDDLAWSIFRRSVPGADGELEERFRVQIGKFADGALRATTRVEAAPRELAMAIALLGYLRIDFQAVRERLYPKIALAATH